MEYIIAKGKIHRQYIEIKMFSKDKKLVMEFIDPEQLKAWNADVDRIKKHLLIRYERCEYDVEQPLPYSQYPKDSLNYIIAVIKNGFFDDNKCDIEVFGKLKSIDDFYKFDKNMKY